MSSTFKTEGIILKAREYKEIDRIYTVYTKKCGKQSLRAQAVRKINSKLAGHLEPLSQAQLFIAEAKNLKKVAGAQTIKNYRQIKQDLARLNEVLHCLEIFDVLVADNEKDEELYALLEDFLSWSDDNRINLLTVKAFIIKLLRILGYQPIMNDGAGNAKKILSYLLQESWCNIQKLRLTPNDWQKTSAIINDALKMHLSKDLQTEKFLV